VFKGSRYPLITQLNRLYDLAFSGQVSFSGTNNPEGIPNALVDFAEGLSSGALQFVGDSHRTSTTTIMVSSDRTASSCGEPDL